MDNVEVEADRCSWDRRGSGANPREVEGMMVVDSAGVIPMVGVGVEEEEEA